MTTSASVPPPAPVVLEPMLFEKVWGGRRLASLGKSLPEGKPIGESWEVADLRSTSAGGAGGGEARSRVSARTPTPGLAGRTLHELMQAWGPALLGPASPSASGEFPLLVKFLDARENLSVQVHPSPAYAASHPGAMLKSECWYILAAEPGAVIYKGLRDDAHGLTREDLERAARDGSIADLLVALPATVGEMHDLPSGTVHALGAGVLVAEVQTPSDTTFRLYDWGRSGRELHLEAALECASFQRPPRALSMSVGKRATLAESPFYAVDEVRLHCEEAPLLAQRGQGDSGAPPCSVVMTLAGMGAITSADGSFAPVDLTPGVTAVVPSSCARSARLRCGPGTKLLIAQPR